MRWVRSCLNHHYVYPNSNIFEDVVPEVQKIVEAASEAAKRSSKKSDDSWLYGELRKF